MEAVCGGATPLRPLRHVADDDRLRRRADLYPGPVEVQALVSAVVAFVTVTAAIVVAQREMGRRRRAERQLEALWSITDPALASLAPDELFAEILARIRHTFGADLAALLVLGDGGRLVVRAIDGEVDLEVTGRWLGAGAGLPGRVAAEAGALLVGDVQPGDIAVPGLEGRVRSFLGCPLLVKGEVCGVIAVGAGRRGAFSADDLRLARRVAERCAWAVERDRFDHVEQAGMEALAETEHRVHTLVEAAPVGIIETSMAGELLRWNRAAAELLGWPRWLQGSSPPAALPAETDGIRTTAAAGHRSDSVLVTVERMGTRSVQVLVSGSPITDREGNVDGVLLLLDDVTDRQQLEQHIRQAQRLGALARLAGGVAHDFNNLLTVIRGYGEVLLKGLPAGDERRHDVDAILVAAERAAELTRQLLTIGRRPTMEPELLDLHDHVDRLAPVLRCLVADGVELRVVAGPDAGAIRVDPSDLDQAVINLVGNANDALAGGGRVMVETRSVELRSRGASLAGVPAGRYVLLTVADTGPGMAPEIVEHCFDPFFTTKGRDKGTGLGLAAVYGTATQTGGHATVESTTGRGATFRMWFPEVEATHADAEGPGPEAVAVADRPGQAVARRRRARLGRKPRVLVVEDEAPVRILARVALEAAGYEVAEAASAEEALDRVEAGAATIDILISDVALGGMSGDELAERLCRRQPGLRVVLMSGFTERPLVVEPDAFLAKPFPFDELVAVAAKLSASPTETEQPPEPPPTARIDSRRRGR